MSWNFSAFFSVLLGQYFPFIFIFFLFYPLRAWTVGNAEPMTGPHVSKCCVTGLGNEAVCVSPLTIRRTARNSRTFHHWTIPSRYRFYLLWIHPHLGLVSYFALSFLIWFSSNVGVSATVNMYKHATLHYIYFLQSISHLYLLFVRLQVMFTFYTTLIHHLLFVGLQGPHCVIIPFQFIYLITILFYGTLHGCPSELG
jgi:hypothetical protein